MNEEKTMPMLLGALSVAVGLAVSSSPARAQTGNGDLAESKSAAEASHSLKLEEIVVTGSRLKTIDAEGPSPVTVFDREKLDQLGVATLAEVLNYLPEQPYLTSQYGSSSGAQFLELRGLGIGSTLILIDGRRVAPSAGSVAFGGFDMNTIPLAAVERVEVLAESASAVYGADAMGGVVNIILKKEIPAPVLDLRYGAAAGGGEEKRASLSMGHSGDRLTASLILDYFHKNILLGAKRERMSNQDFRRFGSMDWRSSSTNPGNIRSRTGQNLPGLPAAVAAVPAGSDGVGLAPEDFLRTAGQLNQESLGRYESILPDVRRVSAAGFAQIEISAHIQGFAELLYVDRYGYSQSAPAQLSGVNVPASNAFNPFGEDVLADFLLTGMGPQRTVSESQLARTVLGVRGALHSWDFEVSALRSEEDANSEVRNSLDRQRLNSVLAASDPNQALNVFQDGPGGSPELIASLAARPRKDQYSSDATLASAFMRGTLFDLPTGSVQAVFGAEWHKEAIVVSDYRFSQFVDHGREVGTGYAELRVPLVAESQRGGPGSIVLTLAARYDDYSDFGGTFNPQVGLAWRPLRSVLLRAGYGKGFRAPSLYELYAPRTAVTLQVVDPRRNRELVDAEAATGGNPGLEPIVSKFASAGVVWQPDVSGSPKVSMDFWRIQLDQRVSVFVTELLLANESRFPGRVLRSEPTPADIGSGQPGKILGIDISRINYGQLDTNGIDLKAQWDWTTHYGRFVPSISATWVGRYKTMDVPETPQSSRVGIANALGTITRWRGVGGVSWSKGGLGLSVTARYTPSYADTDPFTQRSTGRDIKSQTLIDLQGSMDLGVMRSPWLDGFKLSAGVVNLFDEAPRFAEIGVFLGFNNNQSDPQQRFAYVQLSRRF